MKWEYSIKQLSGKKKGLTIFTAKPLILLFGTSGRTRTATPEGGGF